MFFVDIKVRSHIVFVFLAPLKFDIAYGDTNKRYVRRNLSWT